VTFKDLKNNQKLTKVVSTKLSIKDDILLQHVTYQAGVIKEPSKSEFYGQQKKPKEHITITIKFFCFLTLKMYITS
jgi:hypothetical protein